uniref:Sterol desaturase-related protein n=1 Tax=mine drainage metagenome TaxID=410659 RepID=E6QM03_9ZZZZ
MPEWLLWILFIVVLLPVAALCLVLITALVLTVRLKIMHGESVTVDARRKERKIEHS